MDWPQPALWPCYRSKWGPSVASAARAARLNAYALARLAGWRAQVHRFAHGPAELVATFLPSQPRDWSESDALAAIAPTLEALADVLHQREPFRIAPVRVDLAPRLGLVIVQVTPGGNAP